MMTWAIWSVATTTMGETRLGRIWPKTMRAWLMPSARAATTNSRSRSAKVSARMIRA